MNLDEARALISRRDQWAELNSYGGVLSCQYDDRDLLKGNTCPLPATWSRYGLDKNYLNAYYTLQKVQRTIANFVCDEHAQHIWGTWKEVIVYPEIEALHELQTTLESLQ